MLKRFLPSITFQKSQFFIFRFFAKSFKMKFQFLGFLLGCLVNFSLSAQQVKVSDSKTQQGIEGVMIFIPSGKDMVLTDAGGFADLSEFQGEKRLVFQIQGFHIRTLSWEDLLSLKFQVGLQASEIELQSAVISATRWRQSQRDIAERVRSINSEDLVLRQPATSADWMGSTGEVFIQKSQLGGGSPMIRGFSANRLLYSVDGVRMNTAIFRSGNLQNVISLDPFSLQTTEVQFGPGSVMYGSDAIGGVMVFETLAPTSTGTSTHILSRFSSAMNEKTIHANVSYGGEKLRFLTSISRFDFGDLRMGKNGGQASYLRPDYVLTEEGVDQIVTNPDPYRQVQTGYEQINLMQKIRWKASDQSTFDYGFHFSTSSDVPRYDRLIERRNGQLRYARWDYGPQVWLMNNLKWTYRGNSRWFDQLKVIAAHQIFKESRIDRRFGESQEFNRKENVNAFSLNADFLKNFSESTFMSYGMEWVHNDVKSSGKETNNEIGISTLASARYPNSQWNSWALYGSIHHKLSSRWKFQAALRYNFTEIKSDFSANAEFFPLPFTTSQNDHHSLTGNLGLIFTPSDSWAISPLISTGFRAPNVDDIGKIFDSEPGAVLVPNPDLRPEYAYNAEVNFNKTFGSKLKTDFTAFYTLLDQAMVRRPFQLNGQQEIVYDGELSNVLAIQNAAFAQIHGVQAGLEYQIAHHWSITSRYNLQKGVEELDDESRSPSRHAAPAFGLTRITFQKLKFRADLSSSYSAKRDFEEMPQEEKDKTFIYARDENGNSYSPSWMVFNFQFSYQFLEKITVSGGVENISDRQYRPYSSGIVAPGRNFTLTLKADF